jgi:hypothetical protein
MRMIITSALQNDWDGFDGSYAAVACALLGDEDSALLCLCRWPLTHKEALRENTHLPLLSARVGCLESHRSERATRALIAASTALRSAEVKVVNVHFCGNSFAGKSNTRVAIHEMLSSSFRLFKPGARDRIDTTRVATVGSRGTRWMYSQPPPPRAAAGCVWC